MAHGPVVALLLLALPVVVGSVFFPIAGFALSIFEIAAILFLKKPVK
jgi:hypothetical protein